jgi:hypothetical protein
VAATTVAYPPSARRNALAALAALTLLVAAACGGDPSAPAAAPTAPPGADPAAICGAAVDVTSVADEGPDLGDDTTTPEQVAAAFAEYRARLEPPLLTLEQDPPDMVRNDIGTLGRQARYAIVNNDRTAVETEEFEAANRRLQAWIARDCGYPVIRVIATDFRFTGITQTIPAGTVVFTFGNQGLERHDLDIYRIADGTSQTLQDIVKLPEPQRAGILESVDSIVATPGSSETLFVTLQPGRYGVACFELRGSVPGVEGTGPPHATEGMIAEFVVP